MSDKPETLADIAAEIRRGERMFWSLRDCAAYADRIEAAAERERAPGNAAALRDALERIVGRCEGCHADTCEKVCRPGLTSESIHAALAALAAPARNCDRFQTADEAVAGFADFLRALENAHGIYSECPDKPALAAAAALAWLFGTAKDSAQ